MIYQASINAGGFLRSTLRAIEEREITNGRAATAGDFSPWPANFFPTLGVQFTN